MTNTPKGAPEVPAPRLPKDVLEENRKPPKVAADPNSPGPKSGHSLGDPEQGPELPRHDIRNRLFYRAWGGLP